MMYVQRGSFHNYLLKGECLSVLIKKTNFKRWANKFENQSWPNIQFPNV